MKRSKKQKIIRTLKAVSKKTLLITAINLGICGIVWWLAGFRIIKDYGALVVAIGFVYFLVAFASFTGTYKRRGDLTQKLNLSSMGISVQKQSQQEIIDTDKAIGFTVWSCAVGFFSIIIGIILFSI